jgi:predicted O-methyltransferase YrrM
MPDSTTKPADALAELGCPPVGAIENPYAATNSHENDGCIWADEGLFLASLAAHFGGPVLEIGANCGVSTRSILGGLSHSEVLISVDIRHLWDGSAVPNLVQVTADSAKWDAPHPVKWAFIDGDHSYDGVLHDIAMARRAKAGLMVFHDCAPILQGRMAKGHILHCRKAVEEFTQCNPEWNLRWLDTLCGMALIWTRHFLQSD